jgi:hypothetical protein
VIGDPREASGITRVAGTKSFNQPEAYHRGCWGHWALWMAGHWLVLKLSTSGETTRC